MILPSLKHLGAAAAGATLAFSVVGCAPKANDFISDDPAGNGANGGGSYDEGAGGASTSTSTGTDGGDPARAISEADIIQIDGNRLYALSQYGGLSIIDISSSDKLRLLGRYVTAGTPFEMYLRGDTVYAMYTGYGKTVCTGSGAAKTCDWVQTSYVEALDVADAAHVARIGSYDIPGYIADSRIVGDVLYAVSYQDGYCWDCGTNPQTSVMSLDVQDPAHIAVVDRMNFTTVDPNGYGWWKRSIAVNQDRMYVAGVDWDGYDVGHSTIQVVDISDPLGHMVKGASVEAKGQIESRWQMDEKDGVLRVVSQPGMWNTQEPPIVQTFRVDSATQVTPLAELPLTLPTPERLRSVRFDGNRAFAITAVQTDPLFTLDLTDPAHPAQVGQLEMPGWVYFMEPRGDRIYALGYEQNNPEGSLAVSIFDVADLAHPAQLARVHFGGTWSNLPEDQDRIHKAFNVDQTHGAIFVPYSGWTYDDAGYGCGAYESGIQIVDFTQDTLALRGKALALGESRRAFVHGERLFGVSNASVTTFDITNRDLPVEKATLGLSTNVTNLVMAGDKAIRLAQDWWTGAARIEVVNASAPGAATPLGSLDLATLDGAAGQDRWCWGWSYWNAQIFTHGDFAYLARLSYYYDENYSSNGAMADVVVIDVSNPAAPTARGRVRFPYQGWYGWYGRIVAGGGGIVQVGSRLALLNVDNQSYYGDTGTAESAAVEIVDLADPDHPTHATTALPSGSGHTGLVKDGAQLLTSHWAPLDDGTGRVRFYLDRLDPANAGWLTSTNVPGSLLAHDAQSGHTLTVSYAREETAGMTWEACNSAYGYRASWTPDPGYTDYSTSTGTCSVLHRTLNLVAVDAGTVDVLDQKAVDDASSIDSPMQGDDRVFASNGYDYYSYGEDDGYGGYGYYGSGGSVLVIGGLRAGTLSTRDVALPAGDYSSPVAVTGKKLLLTGSSPPSLSVLDTASLSGASVAHLADLDSYAYGVTVSGGKALCSLGEYGVQVVDLSP
jgi:hypothetical protein